jgi:hypothetical protein
MSYDVETPALARLWPYAPDWSRTFDVRRAFKTDIVTSRDSTEQRRATRTDPRISASYRTVASAADRRAAELHMRAWQDKPVVVPDFARWARLTGSSLAGASTLTISPMPVWAEAGQPLVLCKAGVVEEVLVTSVAGSTITLDDPLVNAWSSGDVLRPTFFGLFDGRITAARPNRDTAAFDITIACYPGGEPARSAGSAWASLNSIEVFTLQPDYAGSPSVGYLWPVDEGVAVCLTDGTTLYRRVSDVAASSGNSLVTVDSPWGVALSTANVARISRMPLSRFGSDEMVTSWKTPLSAASRLSFQQVSA